MSAYADREVTAVSRENGTATFLDKPVQSHVLDLVLDRCFG